MANDFKTRSANIVAESLGYLKILFPEMLIEGATDRPNMNSPTDVNFFLETALDSFWLIDWR